MRITVVTGVWGRPHVFEMFAQGIKNLGVEVKVIVAGSEGNASRAMVEKHGFYYREIPNQPLASKMCATTLMARDIGSDYVICLGSDDIISPELMQEYIKCMQEGYDFIGIEDFYFFDTVTKQAAYWGGYREPHRKGISCGAGRVISKRLMDKWAWQPWKNEHSKYLDNSMQGRISGKQKLLNLKELGLFAVDIKSSTNMTPFALWDNTHYIDVQIIKDQFPYIF